MRHAGSAGNKRLFKAIRNADAAAGAVVTRSVVSGAMDNEGR
jgi:hypothetical protein